MDKPFKTVEEQVALLESRGMATDSNTPDILLREGYYSVVNGYKGIISLHASRYASKPASWENENDMSGNNE